MHAQARLQELPRTATVCAGRTEVGAGFSSESSTATLANEAGVTGEAIYMHACTHTKKFISYKSHFAMDAKYLIMANAVMPAWMRK
jgi:hypothetical protein